MHACLFRQGNPRRVLGFPMIYRLLNQPRAVIGVVDDAFLQQSHGGTISPCLVRRVAEGGSPMPTPGENVANAPDSSSGSPACRDRSRSPAPAWWVRGHIRPARCGCDKLENL